MGGGAEVLTDTFKAFAFWSTVVLLKTLIMSFWTAFHRITRKVFVNPEDAKTGGPNIKVKMGDEVVERVRRNHQNDLENVLPFVVLGLLYTWTNPTPSVAIWHFRVFGVSRLLHTVSYQWAVPQPSRGLAFGAGMVVCLSMAVQNLMYFCGH